MYLIIILLAFLMPGFEKADLNWTDGRELTVEGQGWEDTKSLWDRLPARAEGLVREPVWGNSLDSAGILLRFRSDSPSIGVRWTLRNCLLYTSPSPRDS